MADHDTTDDRSPAPTPRTCACGHDKRHPRVRPVKKYGNWGQLAFMFFFTPKPEAIDFVCGRCGQVVDSMTNPDTLERFRYREPRPDER
jgi:hypothetical protein